MANDRTTGLTSSKDVELRALSGFDQLIIQLVEQAERADEQASLGNRFAFDKVKCLFSEVLRACHVISTGEKPLDDFQNACLLNSDACVALRHDCDKLAAHIQHFQEVVSLWNPRKREPDRRPALDLGDPEEAAARYEQDAQEEMGRTNLGAEIKLKTQIREAVSIIVDQLHEYRLLTVRALSERTAENVTNVEDTYVMERLNGSSILVRFDGEVGLLKGDPGNRLYRLIREERVKVLDLSEEVIVNNSSRTVFDPRVMEIDSEMSGFNEPATDRATGHDLGELYERLSEIDSLLEGRCTLQRRGQLEAEQSEIRKRIDQLTHSRRNQLANAKERVDRGIRGMLKELSGEMPRFVAYVKAARKYDEVKGEFVFVASPRISWDFRNF